MAFSNEGHHVVLQEMDKYIGTPIYIAYWLNSFILSRHLPMRHEHSRTFSRALDQLKFFIVVVDYFTKWIEGETMSKIKMKMVCRFYWQRIMCRFSLVVVLISNNGTQLSSTTVVYFCHNLGVKTKFISFIHPQENGQAESANKVILKGIKRNLDDAKRL